MGMVEKPATNPLSVFVEITGRSTVVDRQDRDIPHRVDEEVETPVVSHIDTSIRANGLDDAINEPKNF